jgi:hypothetical protein
MSSIRQPQIRQFTLEGVVMWAPEVNSMPGDYGHFGFPVLQDDGTPVNVAVHGVGILCPSDFQEGQRVTIVGDLYQEREPEYLILVVDPLGYVTT